MNKTVSCNISGLIFNLEELAYAKLSEYLMALKKSLSGTEGSDEVYADIELRIAELFNQKISQSKQVVVMADVEEVIALLGNPSDYVDNEEKASVAGEKTEDNSKTSGRKVFMRDTDNGMIAGVCAGIAAYFGIDITLVRVLFIILMIVPGFGGIAYIILWIAAPTAKTAAEKIQLRGEPVNVDTIKKEVEDAAKRVEEYSKKNWSRKSVKKVKEKSSKIGMWFRSIFGVMLLFGALFSILFFFIFSLSNIGLFTSNDGEQLISLYTFSSVIFNSSLQGLMGWFGIIGTVVIPLVLIVIFAFKLLFYIKGVWMRLPALLLLVGWFFALGALIIVVIQIGRDFSVLGETDEKIASLYVEELIVDVPELFLNENQSSGQLSFNGQKMSSIVEMDAENIRSGMVNLHVRASKDSLFHIYRERSAYGFTLKRAMRLAANIHHDVHLEENLLTIQPIYAFPAEDKLRGQKVTIFIEVPKDKQIQWQGNKKQLVVRDRRMY